MGKKKTPQVEPIVIPANFTPRDYQLDLFRSLDGIEGQPETRKKRAFLRWHRRAGKDKACLAYMFKEMVRVRGVYYYFLPNYQQGRKIIWEGIDGQGFKFLDHLPKQVIQKVNNQEMLIETTNGSIFRVIGTDNIDTIVGTNPVGCIFSEYSLQDPMAWELIRPILAENGGWAIFNGTPRGRNHMYDLDIAINNNPNWYYSELQTLWPDKPYYSGIVSPEAIQQEIDAGMDIETIEQEFGVSYAAGVKGAYYADQIELAKRTGRIGHYPHNSSLWVDTFWDLGLSDSTSIWFRQIQNGRIIFIDYYEDTNKDISFYVKVLKEKGYRYRTHYLPWDGNSTNILSTLSAKSQLQIYLKSAGMEDDVVTAPKAAVQEGINMVRSRFGLYHFNSDLCNDGIRKLELYHKKWDAKRQVYAQHPVHDWTSHCADALRTEGICEVLGLDDPMAPELKNPLTVLTEYDIFK